MRSRYLANLCLVLLTCLIGCRSIHFGSKVREESEPNIDAEKVKLFEVLTTLVREDEKFALTILHYPPGSEADYAGSFPKYLELANGISQVQSINPYDDAHAKLFRKVWQSFSSAEREKTLIRATSYASAVGEKMYLSAGFLPDPIRFDLYFSEEDLLNAAWLLNQPITGVSWNGTTERFDFTDNRLRIAVLTVASKLVTGGSNTVELLESQNLLAKFRFNSNTADPSTRVEPFDLIQGQITASIFHRQFNGEGNRIAITKAVHRKLYKQLKMTPDLDDRAADYQDIFVTSDKESIEQRQILAACNYLSITDNTGEDIPNISPYYIWLSKISLLNYYPHQPLKMRCDDKDYNIEIVKLNAEPLALPPPFDIRKYAENGEVDVLLTYAFSNETDAKLLAGIASYLATKGYFMNPITDIKRGVATLDEFRKSFAKSDIYIPAAHLLDLNTFELGTDKSTVIKFTKTFRHKSGEKIKAKVTAYFPEKNSGATKRLSRNDLAQLLFERRSTNPLSLFVLTTSCRATDAVNTWTSAYRKSLDLDLAAGKLTKISDATDLLHAIAPEGSFPTSTPSELLLDFIGPLDAMKVIFEGGTPAEVYNRLKTEIKPDSLVKLLRKIEQLLSGKNGALEPIYFVPRYNLAEKDILDQTGFDYQIVPANTPE